MQLSLHFTQDVAPEQGCSLEKTLPMPAETEPVQVFRSDSSECIVLGGDKTVYAVSVSATQNAASRGMSSFNCYNRNSYNHYPAI